MPNARNRRSVAAVAAIMTAIPVPGHAADLDAAPPRAADATNDTGIIGPSIATSLPQNGDPAGIRRWLSDRGITYGLIYTNDVLSNLSGGSKRGTIDQGLLDTRVTVDLEKLAGWQGLTLYGNVF